MKERKTLHSNKIEEIIYVDLQVDELQLYIYVCLNLLPRCFSA